MESSDWFRRGALAPAGIEIDPAPGTQARAIVAAEEIGRHGQRQLLTHYSTEVETGRGRRDNINRRVVGRVGIVAEQNVQLFIHVVDQVGEAPAAASANVGADPGPPKVLTSPRGLDPTCYRDWSGQLELEPCKDGIGRLERSDRVDRAAVESPEVDLKHSRLS
jgi:hypothetical protein